MTTTVPIRAAIGASVSSPLSGHETTRTAMTRNRPIGPDRRRVAAGAQVVERRADLGEVARQLVDHQREEAQRHDRRGPPARTARPARRSAPGPRLRASATRRPPTIGRSVTPRTWHCIVIAVPTAASSHHRGSPGRPRTPRPGEGDRARQGDEVRVPDERGLVDGRRGDGHREPGDETGDRPADVAGQPPRHEHGGDPGQRDEGDHRERRIAAGQQRGRGQQVVVERAVVDVADRGRRAEQRHDAVAHERAQHQHVVALVRVPRAACRQVGQPQERGQHEQAERARR